MLLTDKTYGRSAFLYELNHDKFKYKLKAYKQDTKVWVTCNR